MSMLPSYNATRYFPWGKVSFMQNHETKADTAVVSGATTAVYSMGIVIFMQARQGKATELS